MLNLYFIRINQFTLYFLRYDKKCDAGNNPFDIK